MRKFLKKICRHIGFLRYRGVKELVFSVPMFFVKHLTKVRDNHIVFMTNTCNYTCNPKYIYEDMLREKKGYQVTWVVKTDRQALQYPSGTKTVRLYSMKGLRAVYRARIWIDNGIAFSDHFSKKKNQFHIQTMHGSLGIKRLDNAILFRTGFLGKRAVKWESKNTDLVITNSLFEENVFKTIFWRDTPMKRLGHARTDILFNHDPQVIKRIREVLFEEYGVPREKKIVLHAPTHRKWLSTKEVDINYPAMTTALSERFGGEYVVLVRFHDRSVKVNKVHKMENRDIAGIYNVTRYPDIQELMLVSDIGITDYSSWIYDFVLTRKPGFIFATDVECYNNTTGFYYLLEETPFPVCKSNEELVSAVNEFDEEQYLDRVEQFLNEKRSVDDGNSAKRIVEEIDHVLAG